ncbi:2Fe-2S iron-sulfur cluster-binding protein [Acidocella sp.]|uniref:2Fe-2S iron-sulfur cluster-binding protein n=1 Tax=Acidocella sp. TaxID=50710 RepID=UPI0026130631|nr:2Fe-2S iron-sulfur cluster-binding protein [Acidocella sp.]
MLVTTRDGQQHRVRFIPGQMLMDALFDGKIMELRALCGGCLTCATCHVYVDDPENPAARAPFGELESVVIGGLREPRPNSRLACQLVLSAALDGLAVTLAAEG